MSSLARMLPSLFGAGALAGLLDAAAVALPSDVFVAVLPPGDDAAAAMAPGAASMAAPSGPVIVAPKPAPADSHKARLHSRTSISRHDA